LRVCRRDCQVSLVAICIAVANFLDVLGVDQNALDDDGNFFARLCQPEQPFPLTDEKFDPELIFQIFDVLAHTRLGRVKRASCFRERTAGALFRE